MVRRVYVDNECPSIMKGVTATIIGVIMYLTSINKQYEPGYNKQSTIIANPKRKPTDMSKATKK